MQSSASNIEHVLIICRKFLNQKYNIKVADEQLRQLITNTLKQLTKYYSENPPEPALDVINKQTITRIKDVLLQQLQPQQQHSQPPQHPSQQLQPQQPISDADGIANADNDAQDFFAKLEEFEIQRNASFKPNELLKLVAQPPSVPPQTPPTSVPVIYIPTLHSSIKQSKVIYINSIDRDWTYFSNRTTFSWNGQLPTDDSKLFVTCLTLPTNVATLTPLIIIEINGAGNQKEEIVCYHSNDSSPIWSIWKPCSQHCSLIKSLSCPWTINLLDVYKNPLDIGNDGALVTECSTLINGNYRVQFSSSIDAEKNAILLSNNKQYKVINCINDQFELKGITPLSVGSPVCNMHKQSTILLEIIKNESTVAAI
jgi:hypothetical protein